MVAIFFVWQGVPQNFNANADAATLEGAKQAIAQGPVASQEVIKVLGTNGGGFFNANSAHPYENLTALTNLVQVLLLIGTAAGLTNVLGRMVNDERQGWAIFSVMGILLFIGARSSIGRNRTAIQPSPRSMSIRHRALSGRAATWKTRKCALA